MNKQALPPHSRIAEPSRSLVREEDKFKYVHSSCTDLKATFARLREEARRKAIPCPFD